MKRSDLFERLEPPPGGLGALQARMATRPRVVRRLAPAAFALAVAAAVLLFLFAARRARALDPVASARGYGNTSEVALGLAPMPTAAVAVEQGDRGATALAEVRTTDSNVAFYWVSSTGWRD